MNLSVNEKEGKMVHCSKQLTTAMRRERSKLVAQRVKKETQKAYGKMVEKVMNEERKLNYAGVLSYILRHKEMSAGSLRSLKSAVMYWGEVSGTEVLSAEEGRDISKVIDGIEGMQPEEKSKGTIDEGKLEVLLKECQDQKEYDVGDGMLLIYGACLRPRDVRDLTWGNVEGKCRGVYVERKGSEKRKRALGRKEYHVITEEKTIEMMRKRKKEKEEGKVFEGWNDQKARKIIFTTAKKYEWDARVKWNGPHLIRHGAAGKLRQEVLDNVRKKGCWKSVEAAERYGRNMGERVRHNEK